MGKSKRRSHVALRRRSSLGVTNEKDKELGDIEDEGELGSDGEVVENK